MWIDTAIGIAGIAVGGIGVVFSYLAWKAARAAGEIAEETQRKIGAVRFGGEIERLRRQMQDLSRAARDTKWEYASEKCSEITATYGEIVSRFSPLPKAVEDMDFVKTRTQFAAIGKTCNMLSNGQARSVTNLMNEVDEQIAFLSEALGRSGKDVERQVLDGE